LADIDDATLDGSVERGFDCVWLLSVWQTGAAGRSVSRGNPRWCAEFKTALPDLHDEDIYGSSFAITAYTISDLLGGQRALAQFRERLARRGIKLMLDFVPNHTAPDHPWVKTRPEILCRCRGGGVGEGTGKLPAGRHRSGIENPSPWPRSQFSGLARHLQLNYANPELQAARIDELIAITGKCDGVRRDMAMLLLPEAFQRT